MRTRILLFIVGAFACTKPNPNRCCVDAADCQANNIPVGSTCPDGLLCRGNQCVAETCSTAAECDPSTPYCVAGMCDASCSDDTECPGNGEDPSDRFCVSGACVVCRAGMQDCPTNAPICDMSACRACAIDSECPSNVCDVDAGMCIADSEVRYASPAGVDTNDCSFGKPWTPTRAITMADAAHPWVRMLPGTYSATDVTVAAKNLTLVGTDASLPARLVVTSQSSVTVRGFVAGQYDCIGTGNNSIVTLRDVTAPSGVLLVSYCTVNVLRAELAQASVNDNAILKIDRSRFDGAFSTLISSSAGLTLDVTNSVFTDTGFNPAFSSTNNGAAIHVYVAYSTFYSTGANTPYAAGCGNQTTSPNAVTFVDDIFYTSATLSDAFQSTPLTSPTCAPDTSVVYPEPTRSPGTNAIVMDPKFIDAPNGNFHLQTGSPAIDAAKVTATDPLVDFDGTARPQGPRLDIGAFEYKP